MSAIAPLDFEWDGEAMVPANSKRADQQYVIGQHYRLAPYEDRSLNSHNHFFAALGESYKNLPEKIAANFMSFDHFRKWCLVRTGFCDELRPFLRATKKRSLLPLSWCRRTPSPSSTLTAPLSPS